MVSWEYSTIFTKQYNVAARNGHVGAMVVLGQLFFYKGHAITDTSAVSLFEKASRGGEMYATFLLGKLCARAEEREADCLSFLGCVLNEFSCATKYRMGQFEVFGNSTEDEVCFSLGKIYANGVDRLFSDSKVVVTLFERGSRNDRKMRL